jgi:serine/threonine protein kinase
MCSYQRDQLKIYDIDKEYESIIHTPTIAELLEFGHMLYSNGYVNIYVHNELIYKLIPFPINYFITNEYMLMKNVYHMLYDVMGLSKNYKSKLGYVIGAVKPYALYEINKYSVICMEYISGVISWDIVYDTYSNEHVARIFIQLTKLLRIIHGIGIVHCDLKLSNILLTNNTVYIIDYGISYDRYNENKCQCLTTETIQSPEHIKIKSIRLPTLDCMRNMITYTSDIWAFGICLFHAVYNSFPFECENHIMHMQFHNETTYNRPHRTAFYELCKDILVYAEHRPTLSYIEKRLMNIIGS